MKTLDRLVGLVYLAFCLSPLVIALILTLSEARLDCSVCVFIGVGLLLFGAFVSIHNAYVTWIRYLLHRVKRRRGTTYTKKRSQLPIVGIAFPIGVALIPQSTWSVLLMWIFLAIDMGGTHWFVLSMLAQGSFTRVFWRRG